MSPRNREYFFLVLFYFYFYFYFNFNLPSFFTPTFPSTIISFWRPWDEERLTQIQSISNQIEKILLPFEAKWRFIHPWRWSCFSLSSLVFPPFLQFPLIILPAATMIQNWLVYISISVLFFWAFGFDHHLLLGISN